MEEVVQSSNDALDYSKRESVGMGIFSRFANLFTKRGRNNELLLKGMAHANAGRIEQAIGIYDSLVEANSSGDVVRARALFNRALAYSSLKNDEQAIADLNEVLTLPHLPKNVQEATRDQLMRVRKRLDKTANEL
jgi:tetratricopeptide (TPR) repeat protein